MAGSTRTDLRVTAEPGVGRMTSYGFTLPSGDRRVALWSDGAAADSTPGTSTTLTIDGEAGRRAVAIDVLYGYEQPLVTATDGDALVIRDLRVLDYPIIIRTSDPSS
jgi:hypothetical protein